MHPLNKILCFLLLLSVISVVDHTILLPILVLLLILLLVLKAYTFLHAVKRMRWLFLSIVLIYAYGTPGELVALLPIEFAPSYEGLYLGMLQIVRLLIALAALSLLLVSATSQQMMLGLYLMLSPFKWISLDIERFAARLMLTLEYVETLAVKDLGFFNFRYLEEIPEHVNNVPGSKVVTFEKMPFNLINKWLTLLLLIVFAYVIYKGFA